MFSGRPGLPRQRGLQDLPGLVDLFFLPAWHHAESTRVCTKKHEINICDLRLDGTTLSMSRLQKTLRIICQIFGPQPLEPCCQAPDRHGARNFGVSDFSKMGRQHNASERLAALPLGVWQTSNSWERWLSQKLLLGVSLHFSQMLASSFFQKLVVLSHNLRPKMTNTYLGFSDMPCMRRVYRDKKASSVHLLAVKRKKRFLSW